MNVFNKKKGLWRPLHKPYSYKMLELQRKKRSNVHDMLLDNNDPQSIQLAIYLIEMESEFFTTSSGNVGPGGVLSHRPSSTISWR